MKFHTLLVVIAVGFGSLAGVSADDDGDKTPDYEFRRYWDALKVGYDHPVSIPKNYRKAIKKNWTLAEQLEPDQAYDCRNKGLFYGVRVIEEGYPGSALLYDFRGYVAGIQMLFPDGYLNEDDKARFAKDPVYQRTKYWHREKWGEGYQITLYVVDPATICDPYYNDYAVTGIYLQRGPTPRAKHIVKLPLSWDKQEYGWEQLDCYDGMGNVNGFYPKTLERTNCEKGVPVHGFYNPENSYLAGAGIMALIKHPKFGASSFVEHLDPTEVQHAIHGPDCIVDGGFRAFGILLYLISDRSGLTCPA